MFEYANGDKDWRRGNILHREDGPAIITANNNKYWFLNGQRHRTDGPASEYVSGTKHWYLNGKHLSFNEWLDKNSTMTDEEKVMFKLQYG